MATSLTGSSVFGALFFIIFCCLLSGGIHGVHGQSITDPQRPQYHFMPPSNWMNDPNGPMYFNGLYHLFYQYNPNEPYWGDMHWGHAVSKDMVHWKQLSPALYPDKPYDNGGVYSGSATIVNGKPILIYTGIGPVASQCIAYPADINDPYLLNWTKSESNPVIPNSPPVFPNLDGYRDPTSGWQVGSSYYIVVGAGISNSLGMAMLYQTENFVNWTYVRPLYNSTDTGISGDMWECPDFYPLAENHVLKASTSNGDMWWVGDYVGAESFTPINQGLYDYGKMYASKTFNDTLKDRRILWGWTAEMDSQASANARGWAGMQSMPRELTLTADYQVAANPIDELTVLRTKYIPFGTITVNTSGLVLEGITTGDQFEILVKVQSIDSTVTKFGLNVRQSTNKQEQTQIFVTTAVGPVALDMPGSDYRGVSIPANPQVCQSLCYEDFMCRAYTFTPAGMEAPTPMCFLKNYPAPTNPKTGCVSGRRPLLGVDRSNSTLATDADKGIQFAPMSSEPNTLRVFVDHSVIEVFGNDGTSNMITRVYPTLSDSLGVSVFVEGEGSVELDISAWELGSIWN